MKTECIRKRIKFQGLSNREVIGQFDGGSISSDGGSLLLREVEKRTGIIEKFSECFDDYRDEKRIEHTVNALLCQRIYGLALGYEDLNDHDILRSDPLLAVLSGKEDPTGSMRRCKRDKGKALAGKSTLNRLELSTPAGEKGDVSTPAGEKGDGVEFRRFFFHLFVVIKSHATSSQNRCPPASPELAMAGRRRAPCIISYAGVSSDGTFLKTIPIETAFWKDSVLFCKRPPHPATAGR
jgi:hypothetical protein